MNLFVFQEMSGVGLQIQRPVPPHGEELLAMATYRKEVAAALQRVLNEAHFGEMAQQIGETLRQVQPQLGLRRAELVIWKRWPL